MNTVVTTRAGKTRGAFADGVYSFKGIPFAAAPMGANRFQPPQPITPWSGVRDALTFGPKPPQALYPPEIVVLLPPELTPAGEDCLTLNIWSPDLGAAKLPVMVWIPGGEFEFHATGASPWYDGSRFTADGVVCVTINYRVGAEGFLSLGEGQANRGLLDQIAALDWVRENIAAFGGDPEHVTIFGESAGAISVCMLLAMPRAEGLFRRAIAESGGAHPVMSAATAQLVRQRFTEKLGMEPTQEALATVPLERLIAAQMDLREDLQTQPDPERWGGEVVTAMMPWQPVIDGETLPAHPLDRINAGASAGVDVMLGTNTNENRMFLVPSGMIDQITNDMLFGVVMAYRLPVEATLAGYRAVYPNATPGDLLAAIQTDWMWRIPAIRVAEAFRKNAKGAYMYEFGWRTPQFDGRLGAGHGIEMPFVFDTLNAQTELLLGANPPQRLADAMHAAWVAFAHTGDPGWPQYELSRRATMRFDATSGVVDDPHAAERALWEGQPASSIAGQAPAAQSASAAPREPPHGVTLPANY